MIMRSDIDTPGFTPFELGYRIVAGQVKRAVSQGCDSTDPSAYPVNNIGSADFDKCPILLAWLISAEISDNIGWAEIYLYTI